MPWQLPLDLRVFNPIVFIHCSWLKDGELAEPVFMLNHSLAPGFILTRLLFSFSKYPVLVVVVDKWLERLSQMVRTLWSLFR